MKTLFLVRHAKSSWDNPFTNDIDRPLNERGKNDAPMMAERLRNKKVEIDVFISSPAKRARKTAYAFARAYKQDKEDVIVEESLYGALTDAFHDVISKIKNKHDSAAIFSHNPGITEFANMLTHVHTDNMPTCSVFAVKAKVKKWDEFREAEKEFLFFDFPKAGQD